jgi:hypothetical protein
MRVNFQLVQKIVQFMSFRTQSVNDRNTLNVRAVKITVDEKNIVWELSQKCVSFSKI